MSFKKRQKRFFHKDFLAINTTHDYWIELSSYVLVRIQIEFFNKYFCLGCYGRMFWENSNGRTFAAKKKL